MAVQSDSAECVRLLVAAHADLEEKSRDDAVANQMTALCNAAAYGKVHGARFFHASASLQRDAVGPAAWSDTYTFALVRNPWARQASTK